MNLIAPVSVKKPWKYSVRTGNTNCTYSRW